LEGRLGSAIADDAAAPTVARLRIGCYDIFGGSPSAAQARDWIETVPARRELVFPVIDYGAWSELASGILGDRLHAFPMRTFDADRLDVDRLRRIAARIPDGFELRRIDREWAAKLGQELEPHALQVFPSADRFATGGFGVAATRDGTMACAATSYAICSHGVEVAISTHPQFRGQGLALSVSAALMVRSLERGLVPQWSASNPVSQRIAERLGYRPGRVCPLFRVDP
jgi:GNAT superfamily N-acetyltransferase